MPKRRSQPQHPTDKRRQWERVERAIARFLADGGTVTRITPEMAARRDMPARSQKPTPPWG